MKQVQTNVSTNRTPEEVYAYLADFANQAEWRFDVIESELAQGEAGQVGAVYRQRIQQGKRELESRAQVTQADAPSTVAFTTVDDNPVQASGAWSISRQGDETRVVCDVAIEAKGLLRLFEPFMGPQLRKTAARYEQDLAERLA